MGVEREDFDWGVRLMANPFATGANAALQIKAEIGKPKEGRASEVRITFPGTSLGQPLRLLDAQAWGEGLSAIVAQTRKVLADMKEEAGKRKR